MAWVNTRKEHQMFRIINYPQDLKAAHDLIDVLVGLINEKDSIPYDHDRKFCTPAGLNGGTPNDSNSTGRGVEFQTGSVFGVPYDSYA